MPKSDYYGYQPKPVMDKPDLEKPKREHYIGHETKDEEKQHLIKTMGVQGLVYCQTGSKLVSLQGAVSKVTCLAVHEDGCESSVPFTILSKPIDENGYFFTTMAPLSELEERWKLSECKVFLYSSPSEACNDPTDANNGLNGAPLVNNTPHIVPRKKMKLYTVGPFVYSAKPEPINGGYY